MDFHERARERVLQAYEDLAQAAGDFRHLRVTTLELEILVGLFLHDGFEDGLVLTSHESTRLQVMSLWSDRTLDYWERLYEEISRAEVFVTYRTKRDILVARERLLHQLGAELAIA